ncbi:MAG TPA: rhodanese-like domain-containing protein [Candidatus Limnocylindria bacterium]|nr:rhodanese-like domain-containing protein [Candidatus Limnocylindria bacterium]
MSFLFGPKVEQADVKEVADALPKDGAVLVDVREPHEWRAGHVPAAKHIPLQQLPAQLDSLPKDAPVYLICRSGNRSHTAAAFLQRNGFQRPVNVRGGMIAWQRAGLPIEK